MPDKAPWITYRPELKVLDCTVRDGGLVNAHQLSDAFVGAVYRACVEAGVDYMEIGYKNSRKVFPKDRFGPWRHCDEEDLRRVVGDHKAAGTGLKLAAMADAGKSDWQTALLPAAGRPSAMVPGFAGGRSRALAAACIRALPQGHRTPPGGPRGSRPSRRRRPRVYPGGRSQIVGRPLSRRGEAPGCPPGR